MTDLFRAGPPLSSARAVVVLVHGRGGSAEGMLDLAAAFGFDDVAYLAPQAPGHTWYPLSFLAPIERNEPSLSASLGVLSGLVDDVEAQSIPGERIALLGFSQGACLALEFAARRARRYAAIVGFSGGVIGPPGTPRDYAGSFAGTPVFLGCSDIDPHIPVERVRETTAVFRRMGAEVDERIYPGMGHTIVQDEVDAATELLRR